MLTEQELKDCQIMLYARSEKARKWADVSSPYESLIARDLPSIDSIEEKYKGNSAIHEYVGKLVRLYDGRE